MTDPLKIQSNSTAALARQLTRLLLGDKIKTFFEGSPNDSISWKLKGDHMLQLLLLLLSAPSVVVFWLGSLLKIVDKNYIKRDKICLVMFFDNDSISWKLKGDHMLQLLLLHLLLLYLTVAGWVLWSKLSKLLITILSKETKNVL